MLQSLRQLLATTSVRNHIYLFGCTVTYSKIGRKNLIAMKSIIQIDSSFTHTSVLSKSGEPFATVQ